MKSKSQVYRFQFIPKSWLFLLLTFLIPFNTGYAQGYTESFDDISTLSGTGWVIQNNSFPLGTASWFEGRSAIAGGPFNAYAGNDNAYIAVDFSSTEAIGTISNWLITPNRTLRNGDVFTFYTRKPTTGGGHSDRPDRLEVRMSTNGASTNVGNSYTSLGDFTILLTSINQTLIAGVYPETWTLQTVTISGLPAPVSGRIAFRYNVTNAGIFGNNGDYIGIDEVTYTPYVCPTITLSPSGLPMGSAGTAYNQTISQMGALGTPSFAIIAGALPPGCTLSSNGTISGTPTATGTFNFTVIASDASGCAASAQYSVTIICQNNPITFSAPSTICSNEPPVTLTTGFPAGGTYSGTGVSGGLFDPAAGTQNVYYDYTDPYGCPYSNTTTFVVTDVGTTQASIASQSICSGSPINTIALTNTAGSATVNWTRDNTTEVTGIAASGTGDISGILENTTTSPITVTFTVTSTMPNGCTTDPITVTVEVKNRATVTSPTTLSQSICSGSSISPIVLGGSPDVTAFNWTRNNTTTVTGIAASGTSDISGTLTNTTTIPVDVVFTVTPVASTCNGTPTDFTVTVNPTPVVTSVSAPSPATYTGNDNLEFTVVYSEPVTLNTAGGTPYIPLTLNTGGAVSANYIAGSGTNSLLFRYTVNATDQDPDGISIGNSLNLNSATIQSLNGCNSNTAFNNVAAAGDVKIHNPVPQNITFSGLTAKIYGDADFSPGATSSSALAINYTSSNVAVATIVSNKVHIVGMGTTTITASQAGNSDYLAATSVNQTLEVNPKTITVTANSINKVYGESDPVLAYTYTPALVAGDVFTGELDRASGENVGTHAINRGTLALNSNYTLSYNSDNLTINAKPITVTATAKSKIFGDTDPALTYTVSSALINSDAFTGTLTRTAGEDVGTYAIGKGTLALNNNYILSYNSNDLTIAAKPIIVTATAKSKIYGDTDPALTYTVSSALINSDAFTGTLTRTAGEDVGTYAIGKGTLALNSNYILSYNSNDLTIAAKPITVTATAKSKTYGDTDPEFTYTASSALVNNDAFTGSLSRTTGENVGTYAIGKGTLALNGNYILSYNSKDLTIAAKPITVTATAKSKTYGDSDPALTYTVSSALINNDAFTGALSRTTGENVGTYAIGKGTLALNSNYILSYNSNDLTIAAKPIIVTATAKSKTYGDSDPALTYTVSSALINSDAFTGALTRTTGENVGTYTIGKGTLALNGNYILSYNSNDLTIAAKSIIVTATAKSKTYGDSDPALTYTVSSALISNDAFTGALSRTTGENVGTYAIGKGTLALNSNYILSYNSDSLTINAKPITVTATAKSKIYGDTDPALTYTVSSALINNDAFTGALSRTIGENVGTYAIGKGTLALNGNYILSYNSKDLTIAAKPIIVTATAKSKTYGDSDPALTYTVSSALINSDAFTGALTRTTGENVGTYTIGKGTLALNGNYILSYNSNDLTIAAKPIIVTATAKSKTFGDTDPALTYTVSSALINSDAFTGTLTRTAGEDVGTYAIGKGTLALNSNYTLSYNSDNLIITAKPITVTATAKSKTYGDSDPALTYTVSSALISNDAFTGALSRTTGENVGTYAIGKGTLALNGNYILSYNSDNLTIAAKPITVTATAKSKIYGDTDPALTYTVSSALINNDAFTGALSRTTGENVGTYAIGKGTLALNSNYILSYNSNDLTIAAKPITVTATAKSKTYGDSDPALTYTVSSALINNDAFTGALTRTAGENVGTYAIGKGTLALNGNYILSYNSNDLTIAAKPIIVTATAKSKTYGDSDPALTYTVSSALINNDAFTGALSRTTGENVGTYAIGKGTLALNGNYILSYNSDSLTINAKPITVTATAKSKTYGDTDPALTYSVSSPLVNNDAFTGALTRASGENVGTYAINKGTLALSSNYVVTYNSGDLTIAAKSITVSAAAKSKGYGDNDPLLTYSVSPALINNDAFTGALGRTAGENVGTYAINQGTLALNNNYTLSFTSNKLTVTAKPITVSAIATSKVYGAADPALTYSVSPALVNNDAFTGALGRTAGENVGTYAINQGTLALNSNYTLSFTANNLTVTAKPVTVSAIATSKVYGAADPALTYSVSPALVNNDAFTGALARVSGENVGIYAINQGDLKLNSNYTISYKGNNLTVTAKQVTVTAESKSKVYGDADPQFTYTATPALPANDVFTGALTRATGENAGSYSIEKGTLALNSNYTINYNFGSLVINKAMLTATASDTSICPENKLVSVPVVYSGFKNGETVTVLSHEATVNIPSYTMAGNYALTPSGGIASNYSFNYVNGQLTVLPTPEGNISQRNEGPGIYQLTAPTGVTYLWSTGEITNTINVRRPENYTVTVTSEQGCRSQFALQLSITNITVPNTFSPNGDGINDYWTIPELAGYPQASVAVINRDGQLVFESRNFNHWDGKNAGKDLPAGVYFYRVIKTPGDKPITGWLNLLR